jgi:pSer/pThr/pTyr-binding forkhead associated (FHA) protein
MSVRLEIVGYQGQTIKVFHFTEEQQTIAIGRHPDNDVVLDLQAPSRHHTLIEKRGTDYYVEDRQSCCGTFVNRNRIDAPTVLRDGDEIIIAGGRLVFRLDS